MTASNSPIFPLKLETLEDRTLLASDFDWADQAIQGDLNFQIEFASYKDKSQIVVVGDPDGVLSINVDFFPVEVTKLEISSFSDVTVYGETNLGFLVVNDVSEIFIDIGLDDRLVAVGVDRINLGETPPMLFLEGDGHTRLEASDLTNVLITSSLSTLDLYASNPDSGLLVISLTEGQTVRANFQPEDFSLVGFENPFIELLSEDSQETEIVSRDLLGDEGLIILEEAFRNFELSEQFYSSNELDAADLYSGIDDADIESSNDRDISHSQVVLTADNLPERSFDTFIGYNPALKDQPGNVKSEDFTVYISDILKQTSVSTEESVVSEINNESKVDQAGSITAPRLDMASKSNDAQPVNLEDGQEVVEKRDENFRTWMERLGEGLDKFVAKTQSGSAALKDYFFQRFTDEFTPGSRPGLIVDTQTLRNNYKHVPKA